MASLAASSSGSTSDSTTPKIGYAVTFGLELEFNLSFTEPELLKTLDEFDIKYITIQKKHSEGAHGDLLAKNQYPHSCRSRYPSWAVVMPMDSREPFMNSLLTASMHNTTEEITKKLVRHRGYISEPLLMARTLMNVHDLDPNVRAVIRNFAQGLPEIRLPGSTSESDYLLCRSPDYTRWTLATDCSLIGSLKSQLISHLPCKINSTNRGNWDSHGIELISPIFQLSNKQAAINDLSAHLSALHSRETIDILPSTWAGLHIHIGFAASEPEEINLPTLQYLAYILLAHEDLITFLFPRHCSGLEQPPTTKPAEPVDPSAGMSDAEYEIWWEAEQARLDAQEANTASPTFTETSTAGSSPYDTETDEQRNEQQVLTAERTFTNHQNKLSNARYLVSVLGAAHPLPPFGLADAMFSTTSVSDLVHLLQKPKNTSDPLGDVYRGYMYNFANILSFVETGKGKPTVEFRQHECCIDADDVAKWVDFIHAVVRKAEAAAMAGESYMDMLRWNIEEFGEWIGLERADIDYWVERQIRFGKERVEIERELGI
jgi:Putative amidoligase enzyme